MGGDDLAEGGTVKPLRLAPDMVSLRLQVLAFVRSYILQWGEGPSYGEIVQATGVNRDAIKKSVRELIRRGQLVRSGGERGLMLPEKRDEAIRTLKALGWALDEQAKRAAPPAPISPLIDADVIHYDGASLIKIARGQNGKKNKGQHRG